jgi:hypothetical protein
MYAWNGPSMAYSVPNVPPGICLFAVQNGSTWGNYASDSYNYNNIGAPLLRRSYMAFDIINNEVAIAPVKFGTTETSTVVPFQSYGATVPQATKYCGYGTYCDGSWVGDGGDVGDGSGYGGDGSGYGGDGSGGGSSSDPYGPGSSSGNGSFTLDLGVIVGLSVAFGLLTLVGALAAFAVWRKTCCGPREKSGKEVDTDVEQDTGLPTMTRAPPAPSDGGNRAGGTLPTVHEEMTEASDAPPQLPPHITPGTADIGVSQVGEMSAGSEPFMDEGQASYPGPTESSTSAVSKGKGKETGLGEEAAQ